MREKLKESGFEMGIPSRVGADKEREVAVEAGIKKKVADQKTHNSI